MREFQHLAEAVQFVADVLVEDDRDKLALAVRQQLPSDWVLERLRERHEMTPLPRLYADWDFPPDDETFKLGGHDKELGHIHIEFVKSDAGWEIEKIWMCRYIATHNMAAGWHC
mgnify:CR=1 FL=1